LWSKAGKISELHRLTPQQWPRVRKGLCSAELCFPVLEQRPWTPLAAIQAPNHAAAGLTFRGPAEVKLSDGQREAIRQAANAPIMVLTGGPGCGKTFATATIVKLWRAMSRGHRIALCAPTGAALSHNFAVIAHGHASLRIQMPMAPLRCSRFALCSACQCCGSFHRVVACISDLICTRYSKERQLETAVAPGSGLLH